MALSEITSALGNTVAFLFLEIVNLNIWKVDKGLFLKLYLKAAYTQRNYS